jgi:putative membrane protein
MFVVMQVFALVTAAVHLLVFCWESLLFERRGVHHGVFKVATADLPAVRLWSFCVGFYNLWLAGAPIAGVVLLHTGRREAGWALIVYAAAFMALSSLVLLVADIRALSRPRGSGLGGVVAQGVPAAVVLVAAAAQA